jgi:thioredoxin reductase (NADPH)
MPKPVLLTVDDDPDVLRAVERDLRSRYADRYRILRAESAIGVSTHSATARSQRCGCAALADQRMPELDGVGFSPKPQNSPSSKRALLCYGHDSGHKCHQRGAGSLFLMKPWDPPNKIFIRRLMTC